MHPLHHLLLLTQYSFYLPLKLLPLHFYVSHTAAVQDCAGPQFLCCFVTCKLTQMSTCAVCADIQQRLVLQLCQVQPHICSTVSDGKSCYKMEFQVSDGTLCTASLTGVEARRAAAVRSWLGSGDGNDQG